MAFYIEIDEQSYRLLDYSVSYCKLWSSDAGRSLTGTYNGTLIGIFPKLSLTFKCSTESERKTLLSLLNKDFVNIKYWDTELGTWKTKQFYFGDAENKIKKIYSMTSSGNVSKSKYQNITIDAVATSKR